MPLSFAEWDAQRKGGQAPGASTGASDGSILPDESTRYEPGLKDASEGFGWQAAGKELARTAGETAIGVAKSPIDLLNSILHPINSIVGTAKAIAHPIDTINRIGEHPREGGSLIGQLLLAPKVPEAARMVAEHAPPIVGKTVSAVGRGAEAVGGSAPARGLGALGALEEAIHGRLSGTLLAAVPPALEYGGKALQSVGEKIGKTDVMGGLARAVQKVTPGEQFTEPTVADSMRTTVDTARKLKDSGMSREQANQRAGYTVDSTEKGPVQLPSEMNDFNFDKPQSALRGIEHAIRPKGDTPLSPDDLDPRISGVFGERRASAGESPTGTERRFSIADEPLEGSIAERIARMRQENPNIDAEGANLQRRGFAVARPARSR